MKIVNIDPTGAEREIGATGQLVLAGAEVEVSAELAGRPPAPAVGEPGGEGYAPADPGEGLLSQADVWAPAPTAIKAAKAAKEG